MKTRTDYEMFEESSAGNRRLLRQEELILQVTEVLATALQQCGMTRTQLASRLGKTKGFVSQVLAGDKNLTLRTVADIADALGCRVQVRVEKAVQGEPAITEMLTPEDVEMFRSLEIDHVEVAPGKVQEMVV